MQIAVCITGVNDKQSNIVAQIQQQISGANIYYHTFTNRTNLVPRNLHDNLFTMHYPKWHYHPMQVPNVKHGKFQKYVDKKLLWDQLYFDIVPILSHSDCLKKCLFWYTFLKHFLKHQESLNRYYSFLH